jgi:hypothetical protein
MAMWISCNSSLSIEKTTEYIGELVGRYPEIMQYFWVSKPKPCERINREWEKENGLDPLCSFIVERVTDESPYCLRIMPRLLYEVFGPDTILVHGLDYELIRPEDADNIAINGFSPDR